MYFWKRSVAAKTIFALSFFTGSALAQSTTGRLPKTIEGYNMAQVPGTVSPRAATKYDTGRANAGTRLDGVTMYFAPTLAQQADLNLLVREQQTPGSASYHKWLTPAQFASRFGLSTADVATVKSWLEQQGFTVERVANSRTSITFSGSVSQIESAFQTELHNYSENGETHFANATPVSIPSALSGVVRSVRNLDNFRPQPHVRFHSGSVQSNFTSSISPGNHFLTPGDVATIYDIKAAYSAGYTGSGQSIAIMGQSAVDLSDIEAFQTASGLTVKDPTVTLVPNTGTSEIYTGDEAESDLDLEYSSGIAKGATINFVYVGNSNNVSVWDSLQYAVENDIAPIISMSYGACESDLSSSEYTTLDSILEQGAAQGQSIVVSSGDTGSTACYADVSTTAKTVTAAEEALSVAYPASSAYVTTMGGTEFPSADVASTNSTYWESASGSDVIASALSYIPEQVWNDDSATYGSEDGAYYALSAGGGGTSTLTTRPAWQSNITTVHNFGETLYRLVPDISLDSSPDNAGYLYCSSDKTAWSTGQKASCNSGFRDSSSQDLTVAGGTSFAAPIFAGMVAIINQKANSTGQGLINPTLYTLATDATTYASAFHDITSGSNACTAGTTYCSTDGADNYSATTGYDEASGLGSVDLNNLLAVWPASSGAAGTTSGSFTLAATSVSVAQGSTGTSTITVASADSYAGTVAFTLSTTNTSLQQYGCYAVNTLPASANSTATTTLTIYTSQTACTAQGAQASNSLRSFAKATKTAKLATPDAPWQSALRITAAFSIAGLCFLGFGRRRRKLYPWAAVLIVAGTVGFLSGCGSNGSSSSTSSTTTTTGTGTTTTTTSTATDVAAGTYTLTLNGVDFSDSSLSNSTTLTLTVTD